MRHDILLCAALVISMQSPAQSPAERAVAVVLDDWHLAAAQADEARYFNHFAEGAVFLGTDGTERWSRAAFRAWGHPFFARGRAWNFRATRRAITMSKDGHTAWFDEDLATPNLGPCRGSGVLTLEQERWQIQQYNLSVPIPNALMDGVKAQIEAHSKKP